MRCPVCNRKHQWNDNFCSYCGADLIGGQVEKTSETDIKQLRRGKVFGILGFALSCIPLAILLIPVLGPILSACLEVFWIPCCVAGYVFCAVGHHITRKNPDLVQRKWSIALSNVGMILAECQLLVRLFLLVMFAIIIVMLLIFVFILMMIVGSSI